LDENLRLIGKPGLCGRPIGRVVARNRLLTADMRQIRQLSLSAVVSHSYVADTVRAAFLRSGVMDGSNEVPITPAREHFNPTR
jgi:hypothetical protein